MICIMKRIDTIVNDFQLISKCIMKYIINTVIMDKEIIQSMYNLMSTWIIVSHEDKDFKNKEIILKMIQYGNNWINDVYNVILNI